MTSLRSHLPALLLLATGLAACQGQGTKTDEGSLAVTVSVDQADVSVDSGATARFTATVANAANTAVTWTVAESTGCGAIGADGAYTAPAAVAADQDCHVVATSAADTARQGRAVVHVRAAQVAVTPSSTSVGVSSGAEFQATVSHAVNTAVTWSASCTGGGGSIDATTGAFTAPGSVTTCTVTATSVQDGTKTAQATVNVTAAAQVGIVLSPTTASVATGGTTTFTATLTNNGSDNAVAWTASCGTITPGTDSRTATFTAPTAPGSCTVTATPHADPSKHAQGTVTVSTVTITASPNPGAVDACKTLQLRATVSGSSNTGVTWTVVETNGGTVSGSGLYTAPANGGVYNVRVTASASASATVTVPITVTERIVSVTLDQTNLTLTAGQSAQLHATVTTTCGASTMVQTVTAPSY